MHGHRERRTRMRLNHIIFTRDNGAAPHFEPSSSSPPLVCRFQSESHCHRGEPLSLAKHYSRGITPGPGFPISESFKLLAQTAAIHQLGNATLSSPSDMESASCKQHHALAPQATHVVSLVDTRHLDAAGAFISSMTSEPHHVGFMSYVCSKS